MIPYTIKRSSRSRRLRISVHPDGSVVVTMPRIRQAHHKRFVAYEVQRFVEKHSDWIRRKVKATEGRTIVWGNKKDLAVYKKQARVLITERARHFAKIYGVTFRKISIRSQKSRWGSCSRQGNLSFNYQLVLFRPEMRDAVIVHEICHLVEFNHSRAFWKLVEREVPNWKTLRKELKKTMVQLGEGGSGILRA